MFKQLERTTWGTGMNPTGRYAHMFEERGEKEILSKYTQTTKIEIPPPYPHKRKNIDFFSPLEGSIFSLPSRMAT
jgi:hypothetical protein